MQIDATRRLQIFSFPTYRILMTQVILQELVLLFVHYARLMITMKIMMQTCIINSQQINTFILLINYFEIIKRTFRLRGKNYIHFMTVSLQFHIILFLCYFFYLYIMYFEY